MVHNRGCRASCGSAGYVILLTVFKGAMLFKVSIDMGSRRPITLNHSSRTASSVGSIFSGPGDLSRSPTDVPALAGLWNGPSAMGKGSSGSQHSRAGATSSTRGPPFARS